MQYTIFLENLLFQSSQTTNDNNNTHTTTYENRHIKVNAHLYVHCLVKPCYDVPLQKYMQHFSLINIVLILPKEDLSECATLYSTNIVVPSWKQSTILILKINLNKGIFSSEFQSWKCTQNVNAIWRNTGHRAKKIFVIWKEWGPK